MTFWMWYIDGQSSLWPYSRRCFYFCPLSLTYSPYSTTVKCQAAAISLGTDLVYIVIASIATTFSWSAQAFGLLFNEFSNNPVWICSRSLLRGVQLLDHFAFWSLQVLTTGGPEHFPFDAKRIPTAIDCYL